MYSLYLNGVRFPVTPPKVTIKIKNQNKTVNLINEGEVNLLKGAGLTEIQIDSLLLPGVQRYPFAVYPDGFHRASYYLNFLDNWKRNRKKIVFLLSRATPNRKRAMWDTRMTVSIEDYEITDSTENGFDTVVKIKFKQYKPWGTKKLVQKTNKNTGKKTAIVKKTRSHKAIEKSYVVVKGDCLIKIAKKQLNDSSRWKEIYTLNKTVIESTAKKHGMKSSSNGWWIFPGTKLKLPS